MDDRMTVADLKSLSGHFAVVCLHKQNLLLDCIPSQYHSILNIANCTPLGDLIRKSSGIYHNERVSLSFTLHKAQSHVRTLQPQLSLLVFCESVLCEPGYQPEAQFNLAGRSSGDPLDV